MAVEPARAVLLSMRDIRKSFAGVPANDGISLEIREGEIHALLGENGAGKTTLMNILYGIYTADSGHIEWRGRLMQGHGPREAIGLGIGMVHQHFMLVPTLTVSENITMGLRSPGYPFPDRARLSARIAELSARYGLDVDPAARVASLSVGEQQRVEIMKLLYREARLLILDEPTAVLTPAETELFFRVLSRLRAEGHAVILITHRIPEVMAVADRISVLRDGTLAACIDAEGATPERLSTLMIGRPLKARAENAPSLLCRNLPDAVLASVQTPVPASVQPVAQPVAQPVVQPHVQPQVQPSVPGLAAHRLSLDPDPRTGRGGLRDISFEIAAGEILGIAGVDGNGQKELAECILGLRHPAHASNLAHASAGAGAEIDIAGMPVLQQGRSKGVRTRKRAGLAYISDDRHHDGLMMGMDLTGNYLLGRLDDRNFVRAGFLRLRAGRDATRAAIEAYRIKTTGAAQQVRLLSGGNQQKLILARELGASPSPRAIVAFQPTRGLDIGATEFVHDTLLARRAGGASILLISSDLDELLAVSDRIAVLHRGVLSESFANDGSIDMTRIGLLMGGHR